MDPAGLGARTARASWWGAAEIAARHVVQLAVMLVLARLLAPSDFGLVAMLLVFTSVATLLADSGLGWALIQRGRSDDDEETTAFVFSLLVAVFTAGLLWLGAPAIARFYGQPELTQLLLVAVMVIPLTVISLVPDALLARSLQFRARANAEAIASVTAGTVAIALAWRGAGAWSLVWMPIVLAAIRAPLLWMSTGWRPRGMFRWKALRRLTRFGGYLMASSLLDAISIRLQSVLLGRIFDARTLGFYALAQQTEQAPTNFVASLLNRIGFPVLTTVAHEPEKLQEAFRRALRLSLFLFAPLMVGVAVAARPLVLLLYGPEWEPAAPILGMLAAGSSLWPLHVLNLAAISAMGRSDIVLRLNVVKKVMMMLLVAFAARYGPVAIAGALLICSVLSVFVNTWFSRSMTGYGLIAQVVDQSSTILSVLSAAAVGWTTLVVVPQGALWFALAVAVSGSTYGATALLLHNPALNELKIMLHAIAQKGPEV